MHSYLKFKLHMRFDWHLPAWVARTGRMPGVTAAAAPVKQGDNLLPHGGRALRATGSTVPRKLLTPPAPSNGSKSPQSPPSKPAAPNNGAYKVGACGIADESWRVACHVESGRLCSHTLAHCAPELRNDGKHLK